jgi:hypothetical protein
VLLYIHLYMYINIYKIYIHKRAYINNLLHSVYNGAVYNELHVTLGYRDKPRHALRNAVLLGGG